MPRAARFSPLGPATIVVLASIAAGCAYGCGGADATGEVSDTGAIAEAGETGADALADGDADTDADADACPPDRERYPSGECGDRVVECPAGQVPVAGACVPVGVPASACAVGFAPDGQFGCTPILPADACPPGTAPRLGSTTCVHVGPSCSTHFAPDGRGGCAPTLPSAACPRGAMAIPGDTSCREVASCGGVGGLPAGTLFVDASAPPGGDGTEGAPLRAIGEAVARAPYGGLVMVAAGTYAEHVEIAHGIWVGGRCPSRVEIRGDGSAPVVTMHGGHLYGVSVTGSGSAPLVSVVSDTATIAQVWLHDADRAIEVDGATLQLTSSLIEGARVAIGGVDGTVSVRDSALRAPPTGAAPSYGVTLDGGSLYASGSLLEGESYGVQLAGAHATLEDVAIRGWRALGIGATWNSRFVRSWVEVTGGTLEHGTGAAISTGGASAHLRGATIRDVQGGDGLVVREAWAKVEMSAFANVDGAGLRLESASGELSDTHFADVGQGAVSGGVASTGGVAFTIARVHVERGGAIHLSGDDGAVTADALSLHDGGLVSLPGAIRGSILEPRAGSLGVFLRGHSSLEGSLVRGGDIETDGGDTDATLASDVLENTPVWFRDPGTLTFDAVTFRGAETAITAQYDDRITLRRCRFDASRLAALTLGHVDLVTIEDTWFRGDPAGDETFGAGLVLLSDGTYNPGPLVSLRRTAFDARRTAAIALFHGDVTLDECAIRGTRAQASGAFGDGISSSDDGPTSTLTRGVHVTRSWIAHNARAGVALVGTTGQLASSKLVCNPVDVRVDTPTFELGGDLACGCGAATTCASSTAPLDRLPFPH